MTTSLLLVPDVVNTTGKGEGFTDRRQPALLSMDTEGIANECRNLVGQVFMAEIGGMDAVGADQVRCSDEPLLGDRIDELHARLVGLLVNDVANIGPRRRRVAGRPRRTDDDELRKRSRRLSLFERVVYGGLQPDGVDV